MCALHIPIKALPCILTLAIGRLIFAALVIAIGHPTGNLELCSALPLRSDAVLIRDWLLHILGLSHAYPLPVAPRDTAAVRRSCTTGASQQTVTFWKPAAFS